MSNDRRDFLAKCFGGAVTAASGVFVPYGSEAKGSDAVFEDKCSPASGGSLSWSYLPASTPKDQQIRLETDLTPSGTRLVRGDGKHIAFVNELAVCWTPATKQAWVGFGLFILPPTGEPTSAFHPHLGSASVGPVASKSFSPILLDEQDRTMPMAVCSYTYDPMSLMRSVYCGTFMEVKLTKPLKEHDISFMQCDSCSYYDRCLTFKAKTKADFANPQRAGEFSIWGPTTDINTAQRACPNCGHAGRQQLDFHDEKQLHKLYMVPDASLLALREPNSVVASFGPSDMGFNRRSAWIAQEKIIAQLEPTPNFMNDVFRTSYSRLFGSLL